MTDPQIDKSSAPLQIETLQILPTCYNIESWISFVIDFTPSSSASIAISKQPTGHHISPSRALRKTNAPLTAFIDASEFTSTTVLCLWRMRSNESHLRPSNLDFECLTDLTAGISSLSLLLCTALYTFPRRFVCVEQISSCGTGNGSTSPQHGRGARSYSTPAREARGRFFTSGCL